MHSDMLKMQVFYVVPLCVEISCNMYVIAAGERGLNVLLCTICLKIMYIVLAKQCAQLLYAVTQSQHAIC